MKALKGDVKKQHRSFDGKFIYFNIDKFIKKLLKQLFLRKSAILQISFYNIGTRMHPKSLPCVKGAFFISLFSTVMDKIGYKKSSLIYIYIYDIMRLVRELRPPELKIYCDSFSFWQ